MAEPLNPPSPTPSAAGTPPIKRKPTATTTTTTTVSPPPKRPHINSSSNPDDIIDTASSKPEKQEDEEEVEINDLDLYQELEEYEIRNGINPVVDCDHMRRFCFPYILMGVGNKGGWESKIRHLKFKFKNLQSEEFVDNGLMEEFLLWKKIFARNLPPDTCSRIS